MSKLLEANRFLLDYLNAIKEGEKLEYIRWSYVNKLENLINDIHIDCIKGKKEE